MEDKTPCKYFCETADLWCMLYCSHIDHKTNGPDEVCWEVYRRRKENEHGSKGNQ